MLMRAPGTGAAALVLMTPVLVAGCAAVGRVHPGAGSRSTITGFTYEVIWEASDRGPLPVADPAHGAYARREFNLRP
jgi:hypothetical protein